LNCLEADFEAVDDFFDIAFQPQLVVFDFVVCENSLYGLQKAKAHTVMAELGNLHELTDRKGKQIENLRSYFL